MLEKACGVVGTLVDERRNILFFVGYDSLVLKEEEIRRV